jgi:hypothetical protein
MRFSLTDALATRDLFRFQQFAGQLRGQKTVSKSEHLPGVQLRKFQFWENMPKQFQILPGIRNFLPGRIRKYRMGWILSGRRFRDTTSIG